MKAVHLTLTTTGARLLMSGLDLERWIGRPTELEDYGLGAVTVYCDTSEREDFEHETRLKCDGDSLGADTFAQLIGWLEHKAGLRIGTATVQHEPEPKPVLRELGADKARSLGINPEDENPGSRIWWVEWPDRGGWYVQNVGAEHQAQPFCAVVGRDSECFATHEQAQAWLYHEVEVRS